MLGGSWRVHQSAALPVLRHTFRRDLKRVCAASARSAMPDQVVVCGGGVIGVATAYYLTLQGIEPVLVEKSGIACAASGT